eukprot:TRINITY_DN8936_c2_g1_i1.p3 TRINITY_DN8936_c2_g1~~TRINITY_DN8936_c2_g1_i1.p3  ORF type:complete len:107 (-),score=3.02 TRINITY_DN8936_c2_g1_i1:47-367(-)
MYFKHNFKFRQGQLHAFVSIYFQFFLKNKNEKGNKRRVGQNDQNNLLFQQEKTIAQVSTVQNGNPSSYFHSFCFFGKSRSLGCQHKQAKQKYNPNKLARRDRQEIG